MQVFQEGVGSENTSLNLLQFIKLKSGLSNKAIKKLLENHACSINGVVEHFGTTPLHAKDIVKWQIEESNTLNASFKPNVLINDADYIVVDKPSKFTSESIPALVNSKYFLVHRLDKETTGALLLAKSKVALEGLTEVFRKRKVEKRYLAIVQGPLKDEGFVNNHLAKKREYQGQSCYASTLGIGLAAKTYYKVLHRKGEFALVLCRPVTGRTHQIRVHLSELNAPIIGDYQYGYRMKGDHSQQRVFLHALELAFEWKGKLIKVKAPLPSDFIELLKEIGIPCSGF